MAGAHRSLRPRPLLDDVGLRDLDPDLRCYLRVSRPRADAASLVRRTSSPSDGRSAHRDRRGRSPVVAVVLEQQPPRAPPPHAWSALVRAACTLASDERRDPRRKRRLPLRRLRRDRPPLLRDTQGLAGPPGSHMIRETAEHAIPPTVIVAGEARTIDDLERVARLGALAELAPGTESRLFASVDMLEAAIARG